MTPLKCRYGHVFDTGTVIGDTLLLTCKHCGYQTSVELGGEG